MRCRGWSICCLALSAMLWPAGCAKPKGPAASEHSVAEDVQRGKERLQHQNDLHQLALSYQELDDTNQRPPSLEELKASFKRDPKLYQALQEGRYVLVPKVKPGSTAVLAYEKEPDLNGKRLVVRADTSVQDMNEQELQQALKEGK